MNEGLFQLGALEIVTSAAVPPGVVAIVDCRMLDENERRRLLGEDATARLKTRRVVLVRDVGTVDAIRAACLPENKRAE